MWKACMTFNSNISRLYRCTLYNYYLLRQLQLLRRLQCRIRWEDHYELEADKYYEGGSLTQIENDRTINSYLRQIEQQANGNTYTSTNVQSSPNVLTDINSRIIKCSGMQDVFGRWETHLKFVIETEYKRKRQLGRTRHWWDNNIKIELKHLYELGKIQQLQRRLSMRKWTFECHKQWPNSFPVEPL